MAQAMIAPAQAAAVLCPLLQHEPVEVAVLLCLNAKLELLAYHSLSRGTLDHSIVHARDVYRTALLANAAAVILGHNHPSGHLEPSPDDRSLTQALAAAGTLLGIELRDHIIVTPDGRWLSFNQLALL
jgi:DNA repair protein RadC